VVRCRTGITITEAGSILVLKRTAAKRVALVHGDVSPKNILIGPHGPVLLDAECAWFGDPAFDIAFCLNHLLLKCLVRPHGRKTLFAAFDALAEAYFEEVKWEPRADLENRAATLLPALLLARVDGKSPLEYIVKESGKDTVRVTATSLLSRPVQKLSEIADRWEKNLRNADEQEPEADRAP
jgi:Ser/Thr protein kinase RdoA (MazF antagonist)